MKNPLNARFVGLSRGVFNATDTGVISIAKVVIYLRILLFAVNYCIFSFGQAVVPHFE